MSEPLRVLGDRVLIRPDVEDRRVEQADSGLYTAPTLAAAVTGEDTTIWYTSGTVVQLGEWPTDVKAWALTRLWAIEHECAAVVSVKEITAIRRALEDLPAQRVRDLAVGDRVTFSVQAGQDVTVNGEPFVIMREQDILAVVEPEVV